MKQILINLNRIKAALLSGKSAAYWSMFYMGIGPFTRIIDRLFLKPLVKKSNEICFQYPSMEDDIYQHE